MRIPLDLVVIWITVSMGACPGRFRRRQAALALCVVLVCVSALDASGGARPCSLCTFGPLVRWLVHGTARGLRHLVVFSPGTLRVPVAGRFLGVYRGPLVRWFVRGPGAEGTHGPFLCTLKVF